jgi:N6-adenosine-specific RNA methylase IME4
MNYSLVRWEETVRSIAECKTIDEVKAIHDKAVAFEAYTRVSGEGRIAQNDIAEIRLRAERRGGELLRELGRNQVVGPGRGKTIPARVNGFSEYADACAKLGEGKTGYNRALRWQDEADISDEDFEDYIQRIKTANEGELTSKGLLRFGNNLKQSESEAAPLAPLPPGKFRAIYADPPWSYSNSGFAQSAASKYPTMSLDRICDMPIADKAVDETVLFLWATSPLLPDALTVMGAWDFQYKASMVWIKDRAPGMGWYVNTKHEFLLIGAGRSTPHPKVKLDSVVTAPVSKHSKKPEEFYALIEQMYEGPYLELFARNKREGWERWGNEATQQ